MNKLHKCCMCGELAIWRKKKESDSDVIYYCDKCVPRGDIENVDNLEDCGEPISDIMYKPKLMWWDKDVKKGDLLKNGSYERTKNSFYYEYLEDDGRRNPPLSFTRKSDGFPIYDKTKEKKTTTENILTAHGKFTSILSPYENKLVSKVISEILLQYEAPVSNPTMLYNSFMSQMGDKIKEKSLIIGYKNNLNKYFQKFKKELTLSKK